MRTWSTMSKAAVLVCAVALGGCNNFPGSGPVANAPQASSQDAATLAKLEGNLPKSERDLKFAKAQYRERNFGKAEETFRRIVEEEPANAEAWLGLAASYDQLRRFKLSDRAYKQVRTLNGESVALHNNLGYSYLLRGDRRRARQSFLRAAGMDPNNPFVQNNMAALALRNR